MMAMGSPPPTITPMSFRLDGGFDDFGFDDFGFDSFGLDGLRGRLSTFFFDLIKGAKISLIDGRKGSLIVTLLFRVLCSIFFSTLGTSNGAVAIVDRVGSAPRGAFLCINRKYATIVATRSSPIII